MIDQWASQRGLAGREAVFELLRELERRTRELGILYDLRDAFYLCCVFACSFFSSPSCCWLLLLLLWMQMLTMLMLLMMMLMLMMMMMMMMVTWTFLTATRVYYRQRGREAPVAWDQPAPLTPGSLQYNTFVHVQTYNAALRCCYSVDDMMEMVLEPMALHGVAPGTRTITPSSPVVNKLDWYLMYADNCALYW